MSRIPIPRAKRQLLPQMAQMPVGQGTYGCVYNPPLPCQTECTDQRCQTGVSKLLGAKAAFSEMAAFNALPEDFDNEEQFIINRPHVCKTDPRWTATCEGPNTTDPYLLLYTDGGTDLHDLIHVRKMRDPNIYINGLRNIISGLARIHRIPSQHMDLKPDNIVTGTDGNHFRLIDFGFLVPSDRLNIPDPILKTPYKYWPLDTVLASNCRVTNEDIAAFVDSSVENNIIMKHRSKIELFNFLIDLRATNITVKQIKRKIDVFSLGIIMRDIATLFEQVNPIFAANLRGFISINRMLDFDPNNRPQMRTVLDMFNATFRPASDI